MGMASKMSKLMGGAQSGASSGPMAAVASMMSGGGIPEGLPGAGLMNKMMAKIQEKKNQAA